MNGTTSDALADPNVGWATAAMLPTSALADFARDLLAQEDDWDQPARVVGFTSAGAAPASRNELALIARHVGTTHLTDAMATGAAPLSGPSGLALAFIDFGRIQGHPYDALVGRDVPPGIGVMAIITEAWMTIPDTLGFRDLIHDGTEPADDGRYECRLITLVDRLGRFANGIAIRNGGMELDVVDADVARNLPTDDFGMAGMLGGRMVDVARCGMGLPGRPLTNRPWERLAAAWARIATLNAAAVLRQPTGLVGLLRLRPDIAVADLRRTTEAIQDAITAAGLDPATADHDAIFSAARTASPRPLIGPDGSPDAAEEAVDRLGVFDAGWQAIGAAVVHLNDMLDMGIDRTDWWDPQSLLNRFETEVQPPGDPEDAFEAFRAIDWPLSFSDSAERFFRRAADTVVEPMPLPPPPVG